MRLIDADKLIEDIECSADLGGALGLVVECVKKYACFMASSATTISAQPDIIHLQKEQEYMRGWEDGRKNLIEQLPSAQPEEVIPHRNYKYLSNYWCECGCHLGKKGEVKYCSDCGRKVNWDG